ncbi:MAG: MFS transporter [Spirochaetes bacterium]|nr:MFS transporter [Spirochaetota bacterium]
MREKLSWRAKLLYGSGDTGFSLTSTIIGVYFAVFLTDVVGLAPGVASAAIFIGRTWDYFNDPFIGYLSDRTRTRWGRRRPFLLFGALPFAVVFTLLWWRPPFSSPVALAVYYAIAYLVYDTGATFVYMPYFALTPELTPDYDERTSLTTYRMFFSIAGSLVAFTVPIAIVGAFHPENATRVLLMGGIFGLASALPLLGVFAGTREKAEYATQEQPKVIASLLAAVKNRPFRLSLLIYLFTWMTMDLMQMIILYFVKHAMGRENQSDLLMGTIFGVAILSLPLWNYVARRYNKRIAYVVGVGFWAAMQMVIMTFGPATPLALIIVVCALAGVGVGAAHVLPWSILPDAVEYDEWKTGTRHEGTFYSLVTLAQKVASSAAVPLALLLLQVTGYVGTVETQPASAVRTIRIITGPIPLVLLSLGIACAALYPIGREEFAKITAELVARRARAKRTARTKKQP